MKTESMMERRGRGRNEGRKKRMKENPHIYGERERGLELLWKKNVEWSKDNDPEIYVRVMVFLLATKV